MHSISDLTTFARKTKGQVPPQLVGASTTVVRNKMYLFGGRLVSLRRMVADLYVFDLETFVWEKLVPDEHVPGARYFHSTDVWNDRLLVVFGGMGYANEGVGGKPGGVNEELCVLNDVRFYDLKHKRWLPPTPPLSPSPESSSSNPFIPRARYAHLSSVTSDRLFIIGGQDMTNIWLDDIHVYDLRARAWVQRHDYPRHCGTYRSVAVAGRQRVRIPQEEEKPESLGLLGAPGGRFKLDPGATPSSPSRTGIVTDPDTFVHLQYSADPTPEFPCDILLYSNYNFTDVRRELEIISPSPSSFTIADRSDAMSGHSLPPGLRFPTGAILGTHLIIAGTYLAHSYQSFSVWALNLVTLTWSRIDAGTTLGTGSWSRGVLWPEQNKFLIFGNRSGNLVEDYNRRLLSWEHVAYIDLEAFGIYQPPPRVLEPRVAEMGLAALEEGVCADFEVVCEDGRKVRCSRRCLEERWPWFKQQRVVYLAAARRAMETLPQQGGAGGANGMVVSLGNGMNGSSNTDTAIVANPQVRKKRKGRHAARDSSGTVETAFHSSKSHTRSSSVASSTRPRRPNRDGTGTGHDETTSESESDHHSTASSSAASSFSISSSSHTITPLAPDPRLTPRTLQLSEPYAVTLALLQYIYSLSLITPLQHAPPVLSALLLLATNYGMPHLEGLVRHAMHIALSRGPGSSVAVYEVATVCDCQSLQIRALKVVMSSSRRPQQQQPAQSQNGGPPPSAGGGGSGSRRTGGGSGGGGGGTTSDSGGGISSFGSMTTSSRTRPRGTSNANLLDGSSQMNDANVGQIQNLAADSVRSGVSGTGFGNTRLVVDTSVQGDGTARKLSLPEVLTSKSSSSTSTITPTPGVTNRQMTSAPSDPPPAVIIVNSAGVGGGAGFTQGLPVRRRERAATVSEMGGPGAGGLNANSNVMMNLKREDSELLGNLMESGSGGGVQPHVHQMQTQPMQRFGGVRSPMRGGPESETEGESSGMDTARTTAAFPAPPATLPLSPSGSVFSYSSQQQQLPVHQSRVQQQTMSSPRRLASTGGGGGVPSLRHRVSVGDTSSYASSHRASSYYASSPPPSMTGSTLSMSSTSTLTGAWRRNAGSDATAVTVISDLGPITPPPHVVTLMNVRDSVVGTGPLDRIDESGGMEGKRRLVMVSPSEDEETLEEGQGHYLHSRQPSTEASTVSGFVEDMSTTPTHQYAHQHERNRPSSTSTGDNSSSQPTVVGYDRMHTAASSSNGSAGLIINTTSGSGGSIRDHDAISPGGTVAANKYDKEVEKARKKLEKLERKAKEKADKDVQLRWEKEEKRRKKLLDKPDPQILADRMRYMGVMGFAR